MNDREFSVLVTGAAGFIGAHVMRLLKGMPNVSATALVRRTTDLWRWQSGTAAGAPARVEIANLQADEDVAGVIDRVRPDVVIHLAMAYQPPGAATSHDTDDVNLRSSVLLAEKFFAAGGVRFVLAGTCFEYGHCDLQQIPETTPCRPTYGYAAAKARAGDAILKLADREGRDALVLRVFSPYGPLEDSNRIVPQMICAALRGDSLALSPGEQVRDYTAVGDVASAFVAAATHPARRTGAYNVCTGLGNSLRTLASHVERVAGRSPTFIWGAQPYRPGEMMRLVGDPSAMSQDLGWRAETTLDEGLRTSLDWRRGLAIEPIRTPQRASA